MEDPIQQVKVGLFEVLQRGDGKIEKLKDQVYMVIGSTRNGKSSLCNNILGVPLIGKADENDQDSAHYVTLVKTDSEYAMIGNSFQSVTLDPNILNLPKDRVLVDMAGFGENRDQVGVMAVSYFLVSCFQRLKKVKFIIVFREDVLENTDIRGVTNTLNDFISLFRFDLMTPETKQNFMRSLSVVITFAKRDMFVYNKRLGVIANKLRKEKGIQIKNKELIIEMIEFIQKVNTIKEFKYARANLPPQKSDIIESFDKYGWEFFDFEKARRQAKEKSSTEDILIIPFAQDFGKLTGEQMENFKQTIQNRIKTIVVGFSQIINLFLTLFRENWIIALKEQLDSSNDFVKRLFDFDNLWLKVQSFIKETYVYKDSNLIDEKHLRLTYPQPDMYSILKSSLSLYDLSIKINDQLGSFEENMIAFTELFPKMINCILPVCRSKKDHQMLEKVIFVLKRGFKEFTKLFILNPSIVADFNQNMKDQTFNAVNSAVSKRKHLQGFIEKMSVQIITRLFKTIPDLQQYEQLLQIYIKQVIADNQVNQTYDSKRLEYDRMFCNLRINVSLTKIGINQKKGKLILSLKEIYKLVLNILNDGALIKQIKFNPQNAKQELQSNNLLLKKSLKMFIDILTKLDQKTYPQCLNYALSISQLTNCIFTSQKIFKTKMKLVSGGEKQIGLLSDYIRFCKEWGKIEKARETLFKKLHLVEEHLDMYNVESVLKEIKQLDRTSADLILTSGKNLDSLMKPFSEADSIPLISLLEEVDSQIIQPSNQLDVTVGKIE